jgi:hypothetical protein
MRAAILALTCAAVIALFAIVWAFANWTARSKRLRWPVEEARAAGS